jgi:hypothetical protein
MNYNDELTMERGSQQRYEWLDGTVFAIAGTSRELDTSPLHRLLIDHECLDDALGDCKTSLFVARRLLEHSAGWIGGSCPSTSGRHRGDPLRRWARGGTHRSKRAGRAVRQHHLRRRIAELEPVLRDHERVCRRGRRDRDLAALRISLPQCDRFLALCSSWQNTEHTRRALRRRADRACWQ